MRSFFEDQGFQHTYRGLVTGLPTIQEPLAKVENKVRVKKGQPVDISINPSQLGKNEVTTIIEAITSAQRTDTFL